jgi:hypothetical protein
MFPNYKMNGTITVLNQLVATTFDTTASTSPAANNVDTLTAIIVPSKVLGKAIRSIVK